MPEDKVLLRCSKCGVKVRGPASAASSERVCPSCKNKCLFAVINDAVPEPQPSAPPPAKEPSVAESTPRQQVANAKVSDQVADTIKGMKRQDSYIRQGETVIRKEKCTLISMYVSLAKLIVFFVLIYILMLVFDTGYGYLLIPVYLATGAIVAIRHLIPWYTTDNVITDSRLIRKSGLLSRSIDDINIGKVEGASINQGFFQRILNYGTVVVKGTGSSAVVFPFIRSPNDFCESIRELISKNNK